MDTFLKNIKADAQECINALGYWDDNEFMDGMKGHKLKGMRPMQITKKLLKAIIEHGESN